MKTKTFARVAVGALALVALVLTVGAAARQHRGGPPPFGPGPNPEMMLSRMTEDLGLSSDQVTQIKAIMTDEEARTEPYRSALADLGEQMRTATAGGQFDEAKVREIAGKQAQALTELIVERERGKSRTYSVLTPDQRTKFEQLRPGPGGPGGPPAGKSGFGPGR